MSQSPDGDFFDPDEEAVEALAEEAAGHSPLTGIFLIRTYEFVGFTFEDIGILSQSPDGDFFDPDHLVLK